MRARRWAGLMLAAGLLVAGVDVPRVAAAPVPAAEDEGSVVAPALLDPGTSSYETQASPAYVGHEVVAPPVMAVEVKASADSVAKAGALPLSVRAVGSTVMPGSSTVTASSLAVVVADTFAEPLDVQLQSLDAATVSSIGGEVVAFGVTPTDVAASGALEVSLDYSQFRYALGGDWAQRVQLVQWSCSPAEAIAAAKACGEPVPVEGVVNDLEAGVLRARVSVGGQTTVGGGGTAAPILMYQSGALLGLSSASGSFAATALSNTGTWQVAGNTGSFTYSYPVATPPAFNGLGPSVSLNYDSGVVDGVTTDANPQASEVGQGWELAAGQGSIERRYMPCTDSRIGGAATSDACWYAQNATITLNGRSSELVPVNGTTNVANSFTLFRLKDDPDWLVERIPSATGNWWTNESWKVTTPEGVVYTFGLNDQGQNSRLARPVRGYSNGFPCYSNFNRLCTDMPYRWMLDKVTDSFGNAMIYKYELQKNRAKTMNVADQAVEYDMQALLTEVLYGKSPAAGITGFRDRVLFTYVRRCVQAMTSGSDADCPAVANANGTSYPDVPTDLYCQANPCNKDVSFFHTKRLSVITTQTSADGTTWSPVGQWNLEVAFPTAQDVQNEKMQLATVTRRQPGAVAPWTPISALLPGTYFGYADFRNREDADPGNGVPYLYQFRLSSVIDDLGRKVDATYTTVPCPQPWNWSINTTDCYPSPDGAHFGIFRRYPVDKVVVTDLVTGAAGQAGNAVTSTVTYDYGWGAAAWHIDTADWWDPPQRSWGQFRGYAFKWTTVGTTSSKNSTVEYFYQGMNGDVIPAPPPALPGTYTTRSVSMNRSWTPPNEGHPGTIWDDDWLAGQVFERFEGFELWVSYTSATRNYLDWTDVSADGVSPRTGVPAKQSRKYRQKLQHGVVRDNTSAAPNWRYTRTDYSIDTYGRTWNVNSTGFLDINGDEQCTRTWYLSDSTPPTTTSPGWMNLVAQTADFAGCVTAVNVAKTFYNNNPYASGAVALSAVTQPLGASFKPVATTSMVRIKNNSPGTDELDRWAYTRATFDAAGRTTSTIDPNGVTTTFGFDATYGYPNSSTYPTVNGITMSTSVALRPGDGQPTTSTDQNARVTHYCYDSLSRLTAGFLPPMAGTARVGDPCAPLLQTPRPATADAPNVEYRYDVGAFGPSLVSKAPSIVITSALQSGTTIADQQRIESAAYIDGLGRTRETQAWSPTTGKIIVSANLFDDRGNTVTAIEPFAIDDTAPGDRTSPVGASAGFATWPSLPTVTLRTNNTTYDLLNRATSTNRKYGSTELFTNDTTYLGTKTISKPDIGSWSATTVDALGRTTKVEVHNGMTAPAAQGTLTDGGSITTYAYSYDQSANVLGGYDRTGFLTTTMTDDGSNQTVMVSDLAGRTVTSTDPNAGVSQFTYDPAGRVTKTVDAAANTINTAYDVLGRQTGRWKGAAASFAAAAGADRVASWTYDTLPGGKGMVASETSWQAGAQYVSSVLAYNARYQVTSSQQTIPGVFGTDVLAGDWKFQASFNEAGQQLSVSTPTGPVDSVTPAVWPTFDVATTGYNGLGAPDRLWQGATSTPVDGSVYVYNSVFDELGRVNRRTLSQSNVTGGAALRRAYTYDTNTGALSRIRAAWTTIGATPTTWFQDETLTRDAIGNVTQIADNGLEPGGGASGVKECFIYDVHNRLVRAHSAATATGCVTTTSAASVAAGSVDAYDQVWTFDDINRMKSRTNKLTAVATNYTYTGAKHAVTGTTGGTVASFGYNAVGAMTSRAGTTLGYDALQRLTAYGSSESYLYSTSNQRLIRTAGTTRTLYLPGMEVTDTAGVRTLTRYVSIAGTQVATKTTTSTGTSLAWNCASPQNSTVCQADAASPGTIPARKRYLPYGGERNTVSFAGTDHGFLGQPEDTTGLTYLNNRYYDPTLGNFVSVDPLVGKTGTPYLYANGNASSLADSSGLAACADDDNCGFAGSGTGKTSSLTAKQMDALEAADGQAYVGFALEVSVWMTCKTDISLCRDYVARPGKYWNLDDPSRAATYEAYRVAYRALLSLERAGQANFTGVVGGGGRVENASDSSLTLQLRQLAWQRGEFSTVVEWTAAEVQLDLVIGVAGFISDVAGGLAAGCLVLAPLTAGVTLACAGPAAAISTGAGAVEVGASLLDDDGLGGCDGAAFIFGTFLPGSFDEVGGVLPESLPVDITHALFGSTLDATC